MNENIILSMAEPYVKDGTITNFEFDNIYSVLSRKEQYEVTEILHQNGIELVDSDTVVLDVDDDIEGDFEVLYDDSIFKDASTQTSGVDEILTINKDIRQSNDILCHLIQEGSRQAAQDLCIKNKRLVDKYVIQYQKRYGNRLDFEDLEQVGFVGLLKAAEKFEFQKGTAFSTYAVFWIRQAISREIMDNGYAIRIPVHMMERIAKVVALDNKLIGMEIPLAQRIEEIGDELCMLEEDVRECLVLKNNYLSYASLNASVRDENETELGELIPQEGAETVEDIVMLHALREELDEVLDTLTERERRIIRLRYGLDDGRKRTLEEIGHEFGVTRERIRQLEVKALRKLRHPSRSRKLKAFLDEGDQL